MQDPACEYVNLNGTFTCVCLCLSVSVCVFCAGLCLFVCVSCTQGKMHIGAELTLADAKKVQSHTHTFTYSLTNLLACSRTHARSAHPPTHTKAIAPVACMHVTIHACLHSNTQKVTYQTSFPPPHICGTGVLVGGRNMVQDAQLSVF